MRTFELLVSAVDRDPSQLVEDMQIDSDAVVVDQCDQNAYKELEKGGHRIRVFQRAERGVGLSRNLAIWESEAAIGLFADEDIIYDKGYQDKVTGAFNHYPEADILLFNVQAMPGRETYHIDAVSRVSRLNCGRYPAYAIGVRLEKLKEKGITFSTLFGGGAKYSNGEDSLFLIDALKAGIKIVALPIHLGHERERESTWFHGYTEKFFFDRGVLYHFLYGPLALPLSLRFLLAHREMRMKGKGLFAALGLMHKGIRQGRQEAVQMKKTG